MHCIKHNVNMYGICIYTTTVLLGYQPKIEPHIKTWGVLHGSLLWYILSFSFWIIMSSFHCWWLHLLWTAKCSIVFAFWQAWWEAVFATIHFVQCRSCLFHFVLKIVDELNRSDQKWQIHPSISVFILETNKWPCGWYLK